MLEMGVCLFIITSCMLTSFQDGVLLALKEPFLGGEGEAEQAEEDESNPYLVVHPNYIIDE